MAKRGNSEGSIYQMADGRWRAAISLGYKTNKKGEVVLERKIFTARTRREVQEKLTSALRDRDRGLPIHNQEPTVGEFLSSWLTDTVSPTVRWKTYRSYEQMLRNHLVKEIPREQWREKKLDEVEGLGRIRLSKLTIQDVQRFMKAKLDADNSASLVRYLRVVLRAGLAHAVKDNLIARNVAALATPPRVSKTEFKPFTPVQARRFLDAARGHRLEALFTSTLALGLRRGEALGLLVTELDLDSALLHVNCGLQRVHGRLIRVEVKSAKGRRSIPIPPVCETAFRQHLTRRDQERYVAGTSWHETGFLFTTTIGTPLDDRNVLREFDKLLKAAKLPKIRLHDLRHTCVSLLAAQEVPIKTISELIGHSDIRLTQNVYQHVFLSMKRDAAAAMEKALNPVATTVATKGEIEGTNDRLTH